MLPNLSLNFLRPILAVLACSTLLGSSTLPAFQAGDSATQRASFVSVDGAAGVAPEAASPDYSARPTGIAANPTSVAPGGSFQCTITLDQASSSDEVIAVSSSSSANFTNLPSSVTVPAGYTTHTFTVTTTSSASGTISLSCSNANGQASSSITIADN